MTAGRVPGPDPRWHGRRHGRRLHPGRRRLLDEALPILRLNPPAGGAVLDLAAAFGFAPANVWLEVGFGSGEHLAMQARARPDIGFIGCEPFVNGVAALLAEVQRQGLGNVRIFDDDARLLLPALPDASLGRAFVLFPDPWPKTRHHKRRFICAATLDELARVLKDDAEVRFASDHGGYVRWTLEHLIRHPAFRWTARGPADWRRGPADAIATRYEMKARAQGAASVHLTFRRRPRASRQNP